MMRRKVFAAVSTPATITSSSSSALSSSPSPLQLQCHPYYHNSLNEISSSSIRPTSRRDGPTRTSAADVVLLVQSLRFSSTSTTTTSSTTTSTISTNRPTTTASTTSPGATPARPARSGVTTASAPLVRSSSSSCHRGDCSNSGDADVVFVSIARTGKTSLPISTSRSSNGMPNPYRRSSSSPSTHSGSKMNIKDNVVEHYTLHGAALLTSASSSALSQRTEGSSGHQRTSSLHASHLTSQQQQPWYREVVIRLDPSHTSTGRSPHGDSTAAVITVEAKPFGAPVGGPGGQRHYLGGGRSGDSSSGSASGTVTTPTPTGAAAGSRTPSPASTSSSASRSSSSPSSSQSPASTTTRPLVLHLTAHPKHADAVFATAIEYGIIRPLCEGRAAAGFGAPTSAAAAGGTGLRRLHVCPIVEPVVTATIPNIHDHTSSTANTSASSSSSASSSGHRSVTMSPHYEALVDLLLVKDSVLAAAEAELTTAPTAVVTSPKGPAAAAPTTSSTSLTTPYSTSSSLYDRRVLLPSVHRAIATAIHNIQNTENKNTTTTTTSSTSDHHVGPVPSATFASSSMPPRPLPLPVPVQVQCTSPSTLVAALKTAAVPYRRRLLLQGLRQSAASRQPMPLALTVASALRHAHHGHTTLQTQGLGGASTPSTATSRSACAATSVVSIDPAMLHSSSLLPPDPRCAQPTAGNSTTTSSNGDVMAAKVILVRPPPVSSPPPARGGLQSNRIASGTTTTSTSTTTSSTCVGAGGAKTRPASPTSSPVPPRPTAAVSSSPPPKHLGGTTTTTTTAATPTTTASNKSTTTSTPTTTSSSSSARALNRAAVRAASVPLNASAHARWLAMAYDPMRVTTPMRGNTQRGPSFYASYVPKPPWVTKEEPPPPPTKPPPLLPPLEVDDEILTALAALSETSTVGEMPSTRTIGTPAAVAYAAHLYDIGSFFREHEFTPSAELIAARALPLVNLHHTQQEAQELAQMGPAERRLLTAIGGWGGTNGGPSAMTTITTATMYTSKTSPTTATSTSFSSPSLPSVVTAAAATVGGKAGNQTGAKTVSAPLPPASTVATGAINKNNNGTVATAAATAASNANATAAATTAATATAVASSASAPFRAVITTPLTAAATTAPPSKNNSTAALAPSALGLGPARPRTSSPPPQQPSPRLPPKQPTTTNSTTATAAGATATASATNKAAGSPNTKTSSKAPLSSPPQHPAAASASASATPPPGRSSSGRALPPKSTTATLTPAAAVNNTAATTTTSVGGTTTTSGSSAGSAGGRGGGGGGSSSTTGGAPGSGRGGGASFSSSSTTKPPPPPPTNPPPALTSARTEHYLSSLYGGASATVAGAMAIRGHFFASFPTGATTTKAATATTTTTKTAMSTNSSKTGGSIRTENATPPTTTTPSVIDAGVDWAPLQPSVILAPAPLVGVALRGIERGTSGGGNSTNSSSNTKNNKTAVAKNTSAVSINVGTFEFLDDADADRPLTAGAYDAAALEAVAAAMQAAIERAHNYSKTMKTTASASSSSSASLSSAAMTDLLEPLLMPGMRLGGDDTRTSKSSAGGGGGDPQEQQPLTNRPILACLNAKHLLRALRYHRRQPQPPQPPQLQQRPQQPQPSKSKTNNSTAPVHSLPLLEGEALLHAFVRDAKGLVWCCETAQYYLSGHRTATTSGDATYALSGGHESVFYQPAVIAPTPPAAAAPATLGTKSSSSSSPKPAQPVATKPTAAAVPTTTTTTITTAAGSTRALDATRKATHVLLSQLCHAHYASPWLAESEQSLLSAAANTFDGIGGSSTTTTPRPPPQSPPQQQQQSPSSNTTDNKTEPLLLPTEFPLPHTTTTTLPNNNSTTASSKSISSPSSGLVMGSLLRSQVQAAAHTGHLQSVLFRCQSIVATEEMESNGLAVAVRHQNNNSSATSASTTASNVTTDPKKKSPLHTQQKKKEIQKEEQPQQQREENKEAMKDVAALGEYHRRVLADSDRYARVATTGLMLGFGSLKLPPLESSINLHSSVQVACAIHGGCVPVSTSTSPSASASGDTSLRGGTPTSAAVPFIVPVAPVDDLPSIALLFAHVFGMAGVAFAPEELRMRFLPYLQSALSTKSLQTTCSGGAPGNSSTNTSANTGTAAASSTVGGVRSPAAERYFQDHIAGPIAATTRAVAAGKRAFTCASVLRVSANIGHNDPKHYGAIASLRIARIDALGGGGSGGGENNNGSSVDSVRPDNILVGTDVCVDGLATANAVALPRVLRAIETVTGHRQFLSRSQSKRDVSFLFPNCGAAVALAAHNNNNNNETSTASAVVDAFVVVVVDGDAKTEAALRQGGVIEAITARCQREFRRHRNGINNTGSASAANLHVLIVQENRLLPNTPTATTATMTAANTTSTSNSSVNTAGKKPATAGLKFDFSGLGSSAAGGIAPSFASSSSTNNNTNNKPTFLKPLTQRLATALQVRTGGELLGALALRIGSAVATTPTAGSNKTMSGSSSSVGSGGLDAFFTTAPTVRHRPMSAQRMGSFEGITAFLPLPLREAIATKLIQLDQQHNGFGGGNHQNNNNNTVAPGTSGKGAAGDEMLSLLVKQCTRVYTAVVRREEQLTNPTAAGTAAAAGAGITSNSSKGTAPEDSVDGMEALFEEAEECDDEWGEKRLGSNDATKTTSSSFSASASAGVEDAVSLLTTKANDNNHNGNATNTKTLERLRRQQAALEAVILGLKALQAFRGTEKIRNWVVPQTGQLARYLAPQHQPSSPSPPQPLSLLAPAYVSAASTTSSDASADVPFNASLPVVRPMYIHVGTATGRLLCRDPNLQNIPKTSTAPADFDNIDTKIVVPASTAEKGGEEAGDGDEEEITIERDGGANLDGSKDNNGGFSLRELFVSRFGNAAADSASKPSNDANPSATTNNNRRRGCLVEIDYSQLEPVAAAAITADVVLVDEIRQGIDQHCKRVALFLRRPYEEVFRLCKIERVPVFVEHRQRMKVFSFQRQYGAGPNTISATTGLSLSAVRALIEEESRIYHGVESFHKLVEECASLAGARTVHRLRASWMGGPCADFLATIEGSSNTTTSNSNITSLSSLSSASSSVVTAPGVFPLISGTKFAFGKGATSTKIKNHPTQGFATELVQVAVAMVHAHLLRKGMLHAIRPVNTVHDSVWLDCDCLLEDLQDPSSAVAQTLREVQQVLTAIMPIYAATFNHHHSGGGSGTSTNAKDAKGAAATATATTTTTTTTKTTATSLSVAAPPSPPAVTLASVDLKVECSAGLSLAELVPTRI